MSDHFQDYRCSIEGEITLDSIAPVNTSGAFCDLFTATHHTAGKLALKRPRGSYDKRLVAHIEIEARVWASLKHPRILQFLGIHEIDENVYLVSPFAGNGSLPEFLEHRPEMDRKRLVIEIAEGLAYLHQRGIIHGDLKGNNVLISSGEHVLLCDFGLAKHITSRTSTSLRGAGSIPWQSPELLQDASRRTFQSDVYAFGITVYEVLSGKEPYADLKGIGSILLATLQGERPSEEPQVAPDGSSYLQFWDETSRCWAQDPSTRPRIIDVLRRLDRQRAEMLVTSQQRVLEESLTPLTQGMPTSQLLAAPDLSSPRFDEANQRNTLDWAHQIRARMNALVNSQQPICRFSRETIVTIIKEDLGPPVQMDWRTWCSDTYTCRNNYVRRITRCAKLGMVCRAWRDAIDNTPELTRSILVDGRRKNIEFVQRYNCDGPLEVLLSDARELNELSLLLGSLVHRLCSLDVYSADLSIKPAPFPILRSVKIYDSRVPDTFAADLLGVLNASQDLAELYLNSVTGGEPATELPRVRIDHPGLQRVQLSQLSPHILSHILHCLGLKSSVMWRVGEMRPEYLSSSGSAAVDLIRSLRRPAFMALAVQFSAEHSNLPEHPTTKNHRAVVTLTYAVHDSTVQHLGRNQGLRATSEWIQLQSEALTLLDAAEMIGILRDLDLEPKSAKLTYQWNGMPPDLDLLHYLPPVTRLALEGEEMCRVIQQLGQPLPSRDTESANDYPQFLCPHLAVLDFKLYKYSTMPSDALSKLRLMIQNRRAGAHPKNGPRKLQRVGLPFRGIEELDFSDPVFEGIEIYEVSID